MPNAKRKMICTAADRCLRTDIACSGRKPHEKIDDCLPHGCGGEIVWCNPVEKREKGK